MNYREKIRKAIECPQFGNTNYGEWGALRLDQRKYIKRLLDDLDGADAYILQLYKEIEKLKEQLEQKENEIKELCKKIKVNEKSRRKMQKSLMDKVQKSEKARKEAIEFIKSKEYVIDFSTFGYELNNYEIFKLKNILDIDKGE